MLLNHECDYRLQTGQFTIKYSQSELAYLYLPTREEYMIIYIMNGQHALFVRDRSYQLQQGDIAFIPAGEIHRNVTSPSVTGDKLIIEFHPDFISPMQALFMETELLHPFSNPYKVLHLAEEERRFVESACMRMMQEMNGRPAEFEMAVRMLLTELLLQCGVRRQTGQEQPESASANSLHAKISEIAQFVSLHFTERISLSQIAVQFQFNPSYLSKLFKQITGFSYVEYVSILRVKASQQPLIESKEAVADIAERMGFDSLTHFGRVFKAYVGMTPTAYRLLHRSQPTSRKTLKPSKPQLSRA
ncbi:helix-turn-helix domain-containing protein [Paenibacillus sp. y28]|uniref:helix-turn-helix domain-containing protein n=1 Tax=Paenibacillus sp. y28 TaxID=3129110 RepID=UPI0030183CF4